MSPVNVGERIRQLRLDLGMSVRTLATQTGFSPSLISQVEHSQVMPSIGSLERIALALGVSLGEFFTALRTQHGAVGARQRAWRSSPAPGRRSRSRPSLPWMGRVCGSPSC